MPTNFTSSDIRFCFKMRLAPKSSNLISRGSLGQYTHDQQNINSGFIQFHVHCASQMGNPVLNLFSENSSCCYHIQFLSDNFSANPLFVLNFCEELPQHQV